MYLPFTKMHGNGNDFIVFDNREGGLNQYDLRSFVHKICHRRYHIGADGVILLERALEDEIEMRYFNRDGSEGEMCGNGARCLALYVYEKRLVSHGKMTIHTQAGKYGAAIKKNNRVEIHFPNILIDKVKRIYWEQENIHIYSLIVGVPHVVLFKRNIETIARASYEHFARKLRCNKRFFPQGTNVNMIEVMKEDTLLIRTYERGVEQETEACGTGSIASSIVAASLQKVSSPVKVRTKGGELLVNFKRQEGTFKQIRLTGNAEIVFEGSLSLKTMKRLGGN